MFKDGFTINGKHSFVDYGLHVKKRQLGFPKKNSIRKTVPFMSGYYDFTKINGNIAWGERPLSYTFDIIGNTPAEVDAECTRILNWLANIHDADIYDDTMVGYHLHGSFESATPSESEDGEHTELTVSFVCHPFKIANSETVIEQYRGTEVQKIYGQPVRPVIEATTGGYWYYRANGAPIEGNKRADLYAGKTQSPFVIPEGEYIFGFAPTNLIAYSGSSITATNNGITFTLNSDGTITANGTATAVARGILATARNVPLAIGKYRMTGGKNAAIRLKVTLSNSDYSEMVYEAGEGGIIVDVTEDDVFASFEYQIEKGAVLNNVVLTPAFYGRVVMTWTEEVL